MKDRIKQYIDYKGITAGDLAVMLEVQRSNISHILNGRNKPGAALIEKLLLVFPDLNARWLLTGKGDMIEGGTESSKTVPESPSLFPEKKQEKEKESAKIVQTNNESVANTVDDVEKMILVYKDGTFASFANRDKR